MERLSFGDLVRNSGVNYQAEYKTLLTLLHGGACATFTDHEFKGDSLFGYEAFLQSKYRTEKPLSFCVSSRKEGIMSIISISVYFQKPAWVVQHYSY